MAILLGTDPRFLDHDNGPGHPERPERLHAVDRGVASSGVADALVVLEPRLATLDELARVHDRHYLEGIKAICFGGGGRLDPDTTAGPESFDIASLAAGMGLAAIDELVAGRADSAFLAVRPPGHHATPSRAMGFCLVNNVAVAAAALAERGERVLVVDIDAHHGNGTQDIFWDDPRVAYVSLHQANWYPHTGGALEVGGHDARGATVNVPLPAGANGDVYRRSVDDVIVPYAERFRPTWVLLSTGFDAHRADPLTGLGLTSGDYSDLTARILALVPAGRRLVFLEGGYDLDAVETSTAATLAAMADIELRPEPVTSGGPGDTMVDRVVEIHGLS